MAGPSTLETDAIAAAYTDEVKNLYHALFVNMASVDSSDANDQKNVERFTTGLSLAKRARDLALNAVTSPPVKETATTPTATKTA